MARVGSATQSQHTEHFHSQVCHCLHFTSQVKPIIRDYIPYHLETNFHKLFFRSPLPEWNEQDSEAEQGEKPAG